MYSYIPFCFLKYITHVWLFIIRLWIILNARHLILYISFWCWWCMSTLCNVLESIPHTCGFSPGKCCRMCVISLQFLTTGWTILTSSILWNVIFYMMCWYVIGKLMAICKATNLLILFKWSIFFQVFQCNKFHRLSRHYTAHPLRLVYVYMH